MKKVVTESEIREVHVDSVDMNNIYAFRALGVIYKLHYLGASGGLHGWAFVSLSNSFCFSNGVNVGINKDDSMILAIKSIIDEGKYTVYEFVTQKEFLKWCLK